MENIIVKVGAYIITILCSIILSVIWIVLLPIRIIADIIFLFTEIVCRGDGYVHNYIACSLLRNINHVKNIYNALIDTSNFDEFYTNPK